MVVVLLDSLRPRSAAPIECFILLIAHPHAPRRMGLSFGGHRCEKQENRMSKIKSKMTSRGDRDSGVRRPCALGRLVKVPSAARQRRVLIQQPVDELS